ncbi:3-methyl-2-oxobutanoate hydroxymethyltransferase [Acidimangrovimonas sediminis]|uniref:3-methyl-2-oxobutanoate hydroxymethyltransferase n=1 Tax=Acidimangrovimonas sediminis TaxID=2056283 RepID=UPI000C80CED8|nr:3-methyl-2-oxobutanoate hydroxymethyltransferase [Acidimangrovimonas sediminis]
MTAQQQPGQITPGAIRARKGREPLVCLTAWTTPLARLADAACDMVVVSDGLGPGLHGLASPREVTPELMALHGRAVARGLARALLVVDLPFGSYEAGPSRAFETAAGLMAATRAGAVRLSGGLAMAETIAFLTARGIPVLAHVGPPACATHGAPAGAVPLNGLGPDAERVAGDALAVATAGAFAVVLERMAAPLAAAIRDELEIPTIGLGAGAACDGQLLDTTDLLGMTGRAMPTHARRYAEVDAAAAGAFAAYAADVRAGRFPGADQTPD